MRMRLFGSSPLRARRLTKFSIHDDLLAAGASAPRRPFQSIDGVAGAAEDCDEMLFDLTVPVATAARLPCSTVLVPASPFRSSLLEDTPSHSSRRASPEVGPATVVSLSPTSASLPSPPRSLS